MTSDVVQSVTFCCPVLQGIRVCTNEAAAWIIDILGRRRKLHESQCILNLVKRIYKLMSSPL